MSIDLQQLLSVRHIRPRISLSSKKRLLECAAGLLYDAIEPLIGTDADESLSMLTYEALLVRERLGSTGLGHGIAIPHARLPILDHPILAVITLSEAIDFDASDRQPVDLIFAIAVPEKSATHHLQLLSALATLLRDKAIATELRQLESAEALQQLIVQQLQRLQEPDH
ncbi:PTS sugar transporter subunit IIA [Ectothiorhodospiraceae bacterium BW-2]|nr:PTS sugar transporter subunit IIA [Ectothiorhodospiraceae bacterium BW-2]